MGNRCTIDKENNGYNNIKEPEITIKKIKDDNFKVKEPELNWILKDNLYYNKYGDNWNGKIINDKAEGNGVYILASGNKYEGEMKNNEKEGKGIFYYVNGDKYEGNWIKDKMYGKGIYSWSNETTYSGEYKDDKRNDFGVYTSSACLYTGFWNEGLRSGHGILTILDPETKKIISKYEGNFNNDKYGGQGLLINYRENSAEIIRGTWKNGSKHGFCRIEIVENEIKSLFYEGFYKKGFPIPPK